MNRNRIIFYLGLIFTVFLFLKKQNTPVPQTVSSIPPQINSLKNILKEASRQGSVKRTVPIQDESNFTEAKHFIDSFAGSFNKEVMYQLIEHRLGNGCKHMRMEHCEPNSYDSCLDEKTIVTGKCYTRNGNCKNYIKNSELENFVIELEEQFKENKDLASRTLGEYLDDNYSSECINTSDYRVLRCEIPNSMFCEDPNDYVVTESGTVICDSQEHNCIFNQI